MKKTKDNPNGETNHISHLVADPQNARQHTPRNVGMIVDALHDVGAARSIVIDEDNVILAGNATVEAAAEAGIEKVHVVEVDGETIVAVRRVNLTPEQKVSLALFDNRTAELADWNPDVLKALADEGVPLSAYFGDEELEAIYKKTTTTTETTSAEGEDDVPENAPATCLPGDLWQLGDEKTGHRLLCGDATEFSDYVRLMGTDPEDDALPLAAACMIADPPYNTGREQGRSATGHGVIHGDKMKAEDFEAFLRLFNDAMLTFAPTERYLFCDYKSYPLYTQIFGMPRACIVWTKSEFGFGNGYRRQHEFIAYYGKYQGTTESDVWPESRVRLQDYTHPMQKPVSLVNRAIVNSSAPGDIILDPFAGSGTVLVAAHQLLRRCFCLEMDPMYCDVILARYEDLTGDKPVLLSRAGDTDETGGSKKDV